MVMEWMAGLIQVMLVVADSGKLKLNGRCDHSLWLA